LVIWSNGLSPSKSTSSASVAVFLGAEGDVLGANGGEQRSERTGFRWFTDGQPRALHQFTVEHPKLGMLRELARFHEPLAESPELSGLRVCGGSSVRKHPGGELDNLGVVPGSERTVPAVKLGIDPGSQFVAAVRVGFGGDGFLGLV
jgi:hypothetical protein